MLMTVPAVIANLNQMPIDKFRYVGYTAFLVTTPIEKGGFIG
jgi:hypothetical protein